MPEGTEEDLTEFLWRWLENQEYRVAGEVGLNMGRIDLVGKRGRTTAGFEVKTLTSKGGNTPKRGQDIRQQLQRYARTGCLDELYLFCERPKWASDWLEEPTSEHTTSVRDVLSELGREPCNQRADNITDRVGLGRVVFPSADRTTEFIRPSDNFERKTTPNLPRTNEAWVCHQVYEWFDHKKETLATREGLLPAGSVNKFVDISAFVGSKNPAEIYRNRDFKHVGVEAKGVAGLTPPTDVETQLKTYLRSGGLTHLYLAVPRKRLDWVEESLLPDTGQMTLVGGAASGRLPAEIGLLTVAEDGSVKEQRKAERVPMKFDAAMHNGSVVPVGWGAKWNYPDEGEYTDAHRIYDG